MVAHGADTAHVRTRGRLSPQVSDSNNVFQDHRPFPSTLSQGELL